MLEIGDFGLEHHELGPLDELRPRLPLVFELGSRSFRLVESIASSWARIASASIASARAGSLHAGECAQVETVAVPGYNIFRLNLGRESG
jgi:hypothetical protein